MSICRGLAKSGTPQLKLNTSHDFILVVYLNRFTFVIKLILNARIITLLS